MTTLHLLFALARTLSISEAVEKVKSSSSKWVKDEFPIRKNFAWQIGYTSLSVDSNDYTGVQRYITLYHGAERAPQNDQLQG